MKNIKLIPRLGLALLLFTLLCTCDRAQSHDHDDDGHDHGPTTEERAAESDNNESDEHDHGEHEEGILLTRAQLEAMDIGFGDFTELKLNDYISATGVLDLPPNGFAAVSARAAGFVRGVRKYVEGDYVKKGAVLGFLENPEFIDHQRQYLEVAAELTFLRQELARQETLLEADAGILKTVQRLRSEVAAKSANLAGLRERLTYLGIDPAALTPENITRRTTLFAPRSGYVTAVNLHEGMYVTPETELMELVDARHFHLELDVFERDVAGIEVGQQISYTVPSLGPGRFTAEVHVIGKSFNAENKTVRVHAHPTGEEPPFVRGRFVEARIFLNDQTVRALPEAAVLRDGTAAFVFAGPPDATTDEIEFERLLVNAGTTDDGFTAVRLIDPLPEGMRIVTKGAYFVYAQSQAGELEHEH